MLVSCTNPRADCTAETLSSVVLLSNVRTCLNTQCSTNRCSALLNSLSESVRKEVEFVSCSTLWFGYFLSLPEIFYESCEEEYSFCPFPTSTQASGWRVNDFYPQGGSLDLSVLLCRCSWRALTLKQCSTLFKKALIALQWRLLAVISPDWMGDEVKWI